MKQNKFLFLKLFSFCIAATLLLTACSDEHMESVNTDETKTAAIDPNAQLTTSLLQTYGDFTMVNFYRCYVSGFTQHFSGNWNIVNYAGSVLPENATMCLLWDGLYPKAINNVTDAISRSADKPNVNAALRIHRVYLMSVLTDIYGDVPYFDAGKGLQGLSNPKYDTQESIYNDFFEELKACVDQLGTGTDRISGDVTSLNGSTDAWRKYANSLRMRFAMRISDVNPDKAKTEFEAAVNDAAGYIATENDDAYIKYMDAPITKNEGANDYDFRYNAFSAILYGQDITQPMFVSSTLYEILKNLNDPRLDRICRHYVNARRSDLKPDYTGTVDLTKEMQNYLKSKNLDEMPCEPGQAWYNDWKSNYPTSAEDFALLPTLKQLIDTYPNAGFGADDSLERLLRLMLAVDFEMVDCPGTLINSGEVEYLLAEAKLKGWDVPGTKEKHFTDGVKASLKWLNTHYLSSRDKMSDSEMDNYVNSLTLGTTDEEAKEAINTQAWILHMMNPVEAWSNLRRSDYPVLKDREKLPTYTGFNGGDTNQKTPTRIRYPIFEKQYNHANYIDALDRMGGTDDWHKPLWWDKYDIHVK